MTDDEINKQLGTLSGELWVLRMQLLAAKLSISAIARSHPQPEVLLRELHQVTEHAIADSLTRTYPDGLIDVLRGELQNLTAAVARQVAGSAKP